MKAFKTMIFLALTAALTLSLTGCMNTNNEPAATAVPNAPMTSQPDAGAAATGVPSTGIPSTGVQSTGAPQTGATDGNFVPDATGGAAGMNAAFDWKANAPAIEEKINQISEIAESRVIVSGDTALVGVKFTSAYQGEMTERIREMIAAVVNEADPAVRTVAVTAEQADVDAIYGYAQQIQSGTDGNTLMDDVRRIVENATTLR